MKKTILLIIALITGIYSANAQYKKGDIELGGEISYKVTDGFHQFAISPEAALGYQYRYKFIWE